MSVERYRKTVGIEPGPLGNAGNAQLQTAEMFNKIGDGLLNVARQESESDLVGAKRVEQGEFLEQTQEEKQKVNTAAYNAGFNAMNEIQAQMHAKNSIAQITDKYFQEGITQDSFTNLNKDVQNLKASYSEALPQDIHNSVDKMVDYYATNATKSMIGQYDAQTENEAKSLFYNAMTSSNEDINNAYMQGDESNANVLVAQSMQRLKTALEGGLMSPAAYSQAVNDLKTNAQNSYFFGQAAKSLEQGNVNEWLTNFNKNLHGLSPEEHYRVVRHVKGMISAQNQLDALNTQNLKTELNTNVKFLEATGNTNATLAFQNKIVNDPKLKEEWQTQANQALAYHSVMSQLNQSTPIEAQDIIGELQENVDKSRNNPSAFVENQALLQKVEKSYNAQLQEFQKDPAAVVQKSPQFAAAIRESASSSSDSFGQTVSSGITATDLDQMKINIYKQKGLPRADWRILPNAEAQAFVSSVQDLPLSSKDPNAPNQLDTINDLLEEHPDTKQLVLADLHRAGLPIATQMFMKLPDTQSASQLQNVSNAWSPAATQLTMNDGITKSDIMSSLIADPTWHNYTESLGATASVKEITAIQNQTYLLARYYTTSAGGSMTESNAVSKATQTLIGNVYNFSSMNGIEYRIPKQLNQKTIEDNASDRFKSFINFGSFVVPNTYKAQLQGLSESQMEQAYRSELASSGHWVNIPDGNGLILVDQNGVPVKDARTGQVVEASWNTLNNPTQDKNSQQQEINNNVSMLQMVASSGV